MHKCTYMSHCACMCIGCVLVFFVQTSPNYFVHEEKVILGKNQICVESILFFSVLVVFWVIKLK